MTPIKVGNLTVRRQEHWACSCVPWERDECANAEGYARYLILSGDLEKYVGSGAGYHTLPMALRVAAEAAGIERQRVRWNRYRREWITTDPKDPFPHDFWDYGLRLWAIRDWRRLNASHFQAIGTQAHEYARERYAALGGAA